MVARSVQRKFRDKMIDKDNLPKHVAIIMDGNGRWASQRNLPRIEGHREGIKRAEEIIEAADEIGIKFITFFAFSSENWKRPRLEVETLMHLLDLFLKNNLKRLMENNVRLKAIGRKDPIPDYLWRNLCRVQETTGNNTGLTVILAFNYGSRQEITDAARKIAGEILEKRLSLEDLDEKAIEGFLYTAGIPDPDILIRTSSELRISNFLLWQISYAELYFPKVLWPDFKRPYLEEAISEYQNRARRFGAINA
ncbi:MAG TPA: isoprenyl transferase [Candidatus Omnitrophota bacterium]|nr:isoprenyl transferase [Candidatus Omnitrophota bacterium]